MVECRTMFLVGLVYAFCMSVVQQAAAKNQTAVVGRQDFFFRFDFF
jgi:hypothetical protein